MNHQVVEGKVGIEPEVLELLEEQASVKDSESALRVRDIEVVEVKPSVVDMERPAQLIVYAGVCNFEFSSLNPGAVAAEGQAVQIAAGVETAAQAASQVGQCFGEQGRQKCQMQPVSNCACIQSLSGDTVVGFYVEGVHAIVYIPNESTYLVFGLVPYQRHAERAGLFPADG